MSRHEKFIAISNHIEKEGQSLSFNRNMRDWLFYELPNGDTLEMSLETEGVYFENEPLDTDQVNEFHKIIFEGGNE